MLDNIPAYLLLDSSWFLQSCSINTTLINVVLFVCICCALSTRIVTFISGEFLHFLLVQILYRDLLSMLLPLHSSCLVAGLCSVLKSDLECWFFLNSKFPWVVKFHSFSFLSRLSVCLPQWSLDWVLPQRSSASFLHLPYPSINFPNLKWDFVESQFSHLRDVGQWSEIILGKIDSFNVSKFHIPFGWEEKSI